MRMEFPHPFQTKSLVLPRRLLDLREPDLQRLTATAIRPDTTLGSLLSPFLTQLVDTAETYPSATGEVLARHIVDLLAVLAGERLHQEAGDTPSAARVLLPRIQVFIDRHLADPDVTPEVIARAHQISVRYLHRLFETEDVTVSRWSSAAGCRSADASWPAGRWQAGPSPLWLASGVSPAPPTSAGCSGPPMGCPPPSGGTPRRERLVRLRR